MGSEPHKWAEWINARKRGGEYSREVIEKVEHLVHTLREKAIPQVCPGDEGEMLMAWDIGPHYVEIELFKNGTLDWFYKNKDTGFYDGDEGCDATNFDWIAPAWNRITVRGKKDRELASFKEGAREWEKLCDYWEKQAKSVRADNEELCKENERLRKSLTDIVDVPYEIPSGKTEREIARKALSGKEEG